MEWVSKLPSNEIDGIEAFLILNVENTKYSLIDLVKKTLSKKDLSPWADLFLAISDIKEYGFPKN